MGGERRLGYRPALDGVRGIAIAAVVSMHAFGWPQEGALGVDLFFVLSGFLITTLLLEERAGRGSISIAGFYARRARRLLPALFVMLAAYAAAVVAVFAARGDLEHIGGRLLALAATIGYVGNVFRMEGGGIPASLGHLWSLAQEEQFYVLWPPALILVLRHRPALLTRLLGLAIACVVIERGVYMGMGSTLRVYLGPDTHSEPILVGCLFAVWFVRDQLRLSDRALSRTAAGSLAGILATIAFWGPLTRALSLGDTGPLYGTPMLTAFAFAAGILIFAGARGTSPVARLLSVRPLRFLGQISYSLYLWHVPVLVAVGTVGGGGVRAIVSLAASLVLACGSRYLIELPFLLRRRDARPERSIPRPRLLPHLPAKAETSPLGLELRS
ncbi:MAG TPA: acyltransferase [Vicinamibacteria bacterium]|jgi:peptidoglycan/LPS O-acetylase OafA/YrhL